jgi:hypothetical protein
MKATITILLILFSVIITQAQSQWRVIDDPVNDAPHDNKYYARRNGAWVEVGGSQEAFKVGGIYLNITGVNPAIELGYGTWTQIAGGRMLVGQTSADSDFDTAEETGGAKTNSQVINHTHPVNVIDGGHTHGLGTARASTGTTNIAGGGTSGGSSTPFTASATTGISATTSNPSDGVASINIMNPYFVVYIWKRIQ